MNLVLSRADRQRAKHLIRQTSKHGADATVDLLAHFNPSSYPALIAFLAGVACESVGLVQPTDAGRFTRGQPDRLTEPQRREAHRRYLYGDRSPEVVVGEREYQRIKAREYRAKRVCGSVDSDSGSETVESETTSGPESALTDRGLATVSTRPKGA